MTRKPRACHTLYQTMVLSTNMTDIIRLGILMRTANPTWLVTPQAQVSPCQAGLTTGIVACSSSMQGRLLDLFGVASPQRLVGWVFRVHHLLGCFLACPKHLNMSSTTSSNVTWRELASRMS
jgi:hypothetical protein